MLFRRDKRIDIRRQVIGMLNNAHMRHLVHDNTRDDSRAEIATPVLLIPYSGKNELRLSEAVYATSRDISSTGLAVVSAFPIAIEQAVVGLNIDDTDRLFLCKQIYCRESAGDVYFTGFELTDTITEQQLAKWKAT